MACWCVFDTTGETDWIWLGSSHIGQMACVVRVVRPKFRTSVYTIHSMCIKKNFSLKKSQKGADHADHAGQMLKCSLIWSCLCQMIEKGQRTSTGQHRPPLFRLESDCARVELRNMSRWKANLGGLYNLREWLSSKIKASQIEPFVSSSNNHTPGHIQLEGCKR